MTKRGEIKKVIDAFSDDACLYPDEPCVYRTDKYCLSSKNAYKCLMKKLAELGVVIRIDRELPEKLKEVFFELLEDYEAKRMALFQSNEEWYQKADKGRDLVLVFLGEVTRKLGIYRVDSIEPVTHKKNRT